MKRPIIMTAVAICVAPLLSGQTLAPERPPVEVKVPDGFDAKSTSSDPDYGHSRKKPVRVGSKDDLGGPAAERAYLGTLVDELGKPITFERLGSYGGGPDEHIIDGYEVVTSSGQKFTIYIDMYHPESDPLKQPAPKGLFKVKR